MIYSSFVHTKFLYKFGTFFVLDQIFTILFRLNINLKICIPTDPALGLLSVPADQLPRHDHQHRGRQVVLRDVLLYRLGGGLQVG